MKYIRKKDGRIIDFGISKKDYEERSSYSNVSYDRWFELASEGFEIIKTTDTIEELCDGDVLFENGQLKKVHYYKEGYGFNEYGSKLSTNQFVVLFIATDKGLIYVAKMNEKGELELL